MREQLTLKTILLFFLPLIFMTELIQISHTVTNAFLARLSTPRETLAAFSIAFAFNILTAGVTVITTQSGISFISDWGSFRKLFRFFILIAFVPFLVVELTSVTPLGDIVFGRWMGASPAVVRQAKIASAIMGFWTFPVLTRNFAYAMVMIRRKTILITYATVIRLAALVSFLALFSLWFEGAVVGAMATVSGMAVESIYMLLVARPYFRTLPETSSAPASYGDFFRFSWPLMLTQMTENGVVFVVNFFLGQLTQPDLAIAAFGVVYGLVRLLLAPLRNLVQTSQALVHAEQDLRVMFRFALGLIVFYTLMITVLFYTPLRGTILDGLMGLTLELNRYCTPAVRLSVLVAIFWATAALLRGILASMRRTGAIAVTAGVRLVVVAGIGAVSLFHSSLNGAVLGVLAFAGGFAAETIVLGWRLWHQSKSPGAMFPPGPA